jgi:hypothetical protein
LVAAQQHHVDVGVLAQLAAGGEVEGVAAGDPLRRGDGGERHRNLRCGRWFPAAPGRFGSWHRAFFSWQAGRLSAGVAAADAGGGVADAG